MTKRKILVYLGDLQGERMYAELQAGHVTGLMVDCGSLVEKACQEIRALGLEFGVAMGALPGGDICPASPQAIVQLVENTELVMRFKPDVIWLDHLRFDGRWEEGCESLSAKHEVCRFCRGLDRFEIISGLAEYARGLVSGRAKIGYFAVPFKKGEHDSCLEILGQDHSKLSKIFDFISPMLYHRMLGESVGFVGEYIGYLFDLGVESEILPIIQVKDMPDDLEDKLSVAEIKKAVHQALRPSSFGVALFCWEHAVEKGKEKEILKFLRGLH